MAVPPPCLAGGVVCARTGSPGLLRPESTGLVSTAFTDDPLARFALVSSGCAAPAALACALAPERSAVAAPWPDAWAPAAGWRWADTGGTNSAAATARQSPPERYRISIAMISSVVGAGMRPEPGAPSPRRRFSVLELFPVAPRAVNCRWAATRAVRPAWPGKDHAAGSTWNTASRSGSLNHGIAARPPPRPPH